MMWWGIDLSQAAQAPRGEKSRKAITAPRTKYGNITDAQLHALQRAFIFDHKQDFQKVEREEIIGLPYVFEELDLIISVLSNISCFDETTHLKIDGGVLLEGPPGVGKTFCALYLATKVKARFIRVSEFPRRTKDGLSAEDIWTLYALGREYVRERKRALLLFWDDFDAYVTGESDARRAAVAMLNDTLSGSKGKPYGVFLVATSNKAEYIPRDLLRDGRIGIRIAITHPTRAAKKEHLKHCTGHYTCGLLDVDSLVFLLRKSMTPIAIQKLVDKAWQIAEVRATTTGNAPTLTQDDLVRVLLRRLRGAPADITLSDAHHLRHARNLVGQAIVARTLGMPVQLIALSKHGYNGPHVIAETDDEEGIHDFSLDNNQIAIELATLAVDTLFSYPPSSLSSDARARSTEIALDLVEMHGYVREPQKQQRSGGYDQTRGLISLPVVSKWRAEHGLPGTLGVNDASWDNYEDAKKLLAEQLSRAGNILARYGTEGIDAIAKRLLAPEGTRYLTQRDLDACMEPYAASGER